MKLADNPLVAPGIKYSSDYQLVETLAKKELPEVFTDYLPFLEKLN
ncbi:MAG: hypothetical protein WC028_18270 [Candidatus Obscuribacterales bacterium]|jgi:hypothetical protein